MDYIKIPRDLAIKIYDELVCCRRFRDNQLNRFTMNSYSYEDSHIDMLEESKNNTVLLYTELDNYIK